MPALRLLPLAAAWVPVAVRAERWPGVDEAVVERVAAAAGRTPWNAPFAPQGDLRLFCFLVAGLVGGFALGYAYRALFHERHAPRGDRR